MSLSFAHIVTLVKKETTMSQFINATQSADRVMYHATGKTINIEHSHNDNTCSFYAFNIGEGATMIGYSDQFAGTVIKASKNTVTVQRDHAERVTKPEFIGGGFSANCINNRDINYICSANKNGSKSTYTRRRTGEWVIKGSPLHSKSRIINGRHEFYDYNF